jgi:hypothetical protein
MSENSEVIEFECRIYLKGEDDTFFPDYPESNEIWHRYKDGQYFFCINNGLLLIPVDESESSLDLIEEQLTTGLMMIALMKIIIEDIRLRLMY